MIFMVFLQFFFQANFEQQDRSYAFEYRSFRFGNNEKQVV
jgi:hypothetical protein